MREDECQEEDNDEGVLMMRVLMDVDCGGWDVALR